jgi:DNA mismatch repair protein MutS2
VDGRYLDKLEFPKVLEKLSQHTTLSLGKAKALALQPSSNVNQIERSLQVTSEARELVKTRGDISLRGAHDVRAAVGGAVRGIMLSPEELLEIRDTLSVAEKARRQLALAAPEFPNLGATAREMRTAPGLVREISRCLDDRGMVRDSASPSLSVARSRLEQAHDVLRQKLQRIIRSPRAAPYLQEAVVTQRDGRYVVPVKADFKGHVKGVVHDLSASGATVFVEPLSVVQLNNSWLECRIREKKEVDKVLALLSEQAADRASDIETTMDVLGDVDLAFAKARYANAIEAASPEISQRPGSGPTGADVRRNSGPRMRLLAARHPLIESQRVVPIDLTLEDGIHVLVITGPNTGGKTVTLKTAGLLAMMAQAGMHIPAAPGSLLKPFSAVFADIGDEQSIEQSLSTFSSHLTNIISFLEKSDEHSLVLLDELGAGTDPAEGAALAHALVEYFRSRGATTLVATHFPELKAYAQVADGVTNASVEFDSDTLSPTYELTIGLPGRSNAFAIAERLGLPVAVLHQARRLVTAADRHADGMLADLHRLRIQQAQARDAAFGSRAEAERLARELQTRFDSIEDERARILSEARKRALDEVVGLEKEVRRLKQRVLLASASADEVSEVLEEVTELRSQLSDDIGAEGVVIAPPLPEGAAKVGDRVWVVPLSAEGEVLAIAGDNAEVQVGPARTRVPLQSLQLRGSAGDRLNDAVISVMSPPTPSPGLSIDLRGYTVDEAVRELDRYLDRAMRAGLPSVRIIHGKGTGALKRAIRDFLVSYPLVSEFLAGGESEGGEGVTIAELA